MVLRPSQQLWPCREDHFSWASLTKRLTSTLCNVWLSVFRGYIIKYSSNNLIQLQFYFLTILDNSLLRYYSKSYVKQPLSKNQKMVFKTNYRLMQVKRIVESSKGSILQYFRPSLIYQLSFSLFLSGRLHRFYCKISPRPLPTTSRSEFLCIIYIWQISSILMHCKFRTFSECFTFVKHRIRSVMKIKPSQNGEYWCR